MNKTEQEIFNSIGKDYFWLAGKYDIIADLIFRYINKPDSSGRRKILDYGCGPGHIADYLLPYGELYGLDFSEDAIRLAKDRGYTNLTVSHGERTPYSDETFDATIDVLEHIQNDVGAMLEMRRILKPGGHIFFSVPAYKFLWGYHDTMYGHFRRYTVKEIRNKLIANGFDVPKVSYVQAPFILPLFLLRKIKDKLKMTKDDFSSVSPFLNNFLRKFIASDKYILRFGSIPFGVSIVGVAQKNDQII
jgi:SAM-dependent methyltransferase